MYFTPNLPIALLLCAADILQVLLYNHELKMSSFVEMQNFISFSTFTMAFVLHSISEGDFGLAMPNQ